MPIDAVDPVTAALNLGGQLIDRLWPNPAEANAAKLELFKMHQNGELAQLTADTDLAKGQLAVDQAEAQNPNVFVSGWRPFVGWICATGLAVQFVAAPFATWGAELLGKHVAFPQLDLNTLLSLLGGMLGMGGLRTFEKVKGVAAK